jgi:cytochrome P450
MLDGVFHECLRHKGGAMMGRKVLAPTRIGNKCLQPGAGVLIPSRQLHFNEQVWGANHQSFDAKRFAEKKDLLKHSSYRPFGGGVSLCPGRTISKVKVFALVAVLFHRFDVRLSEEMRTPFPGLDVSTPALGVTGPKKGMDIFLDLRHRATTNI